MRTKRKPKYISEVPPIHKSTSHPYKKENFKKLVEFPLLKACERLYDLNINCFSSSANKDDIPHGERNTDYASIAVSYGSLSEKNKKVADDLVKRGKASMHQGSNSGNPTLTIQIPVNERTTVRYVQKEAMRIANQFEKQDIVWTQRYSPEELTKISGYKHLAGLSKEEIASGAEGFLDKDTGYIYLNEEHYKKAKKYEKWQRKRQN
jgi:hypothetical protein